MIRIGGLSVALLLAATAVSFCGSNDDNKVTADARQQEVCRQVVGLVSNFNYKKVAVDDSLSLLVFDRYLKNLDGSKVYFLKTDIDEFSSYQRMMDEYLLLGDLSYPFEMFNRYLTRYHERMEYVLSKIDEASFVFESNAELTFDRDKAEWFADSTALNAYWDERIAYDLLNLKLTGSDEAKSKETLKKRYENLNSQANKVEAYDAFQAFMTAYTESVDPHTNYFNPSNAAAFNIDMARSLEGIGATLRMDNDFVTVVSIVPGGPADKSGLIAIDDKFIAVAQGKEGEFVDIIGWRIDNAIQLIRGAKGTTVRLKVVPKGKEISEARVIEMQREKIVLQDQSAKRKVKEFSRQGKVQKIGVIDIPAFYMDFKAYQQGDKNYKSTTRDVKMLLDSLKQDGVQAVIIDLRGNGGGSLMEAIDLTGLFIKSGAVVQVRDTRNKIDVGTDDDASISWDGPLVVLIDRFSASASEIFAAAIQDYGRGIVLGSQSFGKGTVQNSIDLDKVITNTDNKVVGKQNTYGQINLTVAKFYRISGSSTQHRGVMPDITFPSLYPIEKYGESAEPSALPWDEIKKANYKAVGNLNSTIGNLRSKHEKRMQNNAEYNYLLQDVKDFALADKESKVQLNEKKLKEERDAAAAKTLARDNERRVARGLSPIGKDEPKPKNEPVYDFILDASCDITLDFIQLLR